MEGFLKKINKGTFVRYLIVFVICFGFTRMILNFCTLTEREFDTIRNYYYYRAIFWFLVILLIENKAIISKKISIPYCVAAIIAIGAGLLQFRHAPDLIKMFGFKWLCIALGVYFILDIIVNKKFPKRGEINFYLLLPYIVVNCAAFIIRKGQFHTLVPLLPISLIFLIRMNIKKWSELLLHFSLGYYFAFLIILIKSLLTVPYEGKRYYGIYVNLGLFGIFVGGAFVCSLYFLMLSLRNKSKTRIILSVIAMIISIAASSLIEVKTAFLAMLVVVWVLYFTAPNKEDNKKCLFRFLLSIGIIVCLIGLGVLILYVLKIIPKERMNLINNMILREKLLYWKGRGETLFNPELHKSVGAASGFKEGTLLNAIDRFTSNRLGWFSVYFQRMNLRGHKSLTLRTTTGIELSYPHSVYIAWLYLYGVPIGILNVINYLADTVVAIVFVIKKKRFCLLPMLWLVYTAVTMFPETVYWNVQVAFISLFLLYPLFVDIEKVDKSIGEEV